MTTDNSEEAKKALGDVNESLSNKATALKGIGFAILALADAIREK